MVEMLINNDDTERSFLDIDPNKSNRVVILVNNLGGTSELEMGAVTAAATSEMRRRGCEIVRILVGTFMVGHLASLLLERLMYAKDVTQYAWNIAYGVAITASRRSKPFRI
jgi:hypothetical protein